MLGTRLRQLGDLVLGTERAVVLFVDLYPADNARKNMGTNTSFLATSLTDGGDGVNMFQRNKEEGRKVKREGRLPPSIGVARKMKTVVIFFSDHEAVGTALTSIRKYRPGGGSAVVKQLIVYHVPHHQLKAH